MYGHFGSNWCDATSRFTLSRMRVSLLRSFLILAIAFVATNAGAQWTPWRTSTPRECIYVPANQQAWTRMHIYAPSCVKTQFTITGRFGAFTPTDSTDFDAGYTYY